MNRFRSATPLIISIIAIILSYHIAKIYLAQRYYELSLSSNKAENLLSDIQNLKKVISLNPNNAQYYFTLAERYSRMRPGGQTKAISYYQKAIELNPTLALYHINLGWLYFRLGQYQKAEEALKRSTLCFKQDGFEVAGFFYLQQKKIIQALPYLREAIRLHSESEMRLERIWEEILNSSDNNYSLLTQTTIDNFQIHRWLGDLFYRHNQWELACQEYKKANLLSPKDALCLFLLNLAEYKLGVKADVLTPLDSEHLTGLTLRFKSALRLG
ncbi:MAG: tetratricopeptide repeat protein, partial [bacterium]